MGSVDTSISDLVTIIVKAPNQQIADQTIQCQLNWTIKKLKDYLSEVYPSKPKMEEQKLIYSGKLLTDAAVLKDILRTYEGQENHTVHLVCTTKAQKMNKIPVNTSSTSTTRSTSTSSNANSSNTYRNNTQPQNTTNPPSNTGSVPVSGPNNTFFDQINANQFAPNGFDPRYFWPSTPAPGFPNMNDMNANQQFAYMQQLYAQYFSQYMQMMGQPGFGYMASAVPQSPPRTSQSFTLPNNNPLPGDRVDLGRNQARENQPAVGNDIDEEDGRNNRDWLDWFYVFSRIVVLFSVVYFYSTPLRLLAVMLLVCMFYLHQNIRLQNDHLNLNNNNNNNNVINHNNNANHNNQNNENRPAADNAERDDLNLQENVNANEVPPVAAAPERTTVQSEPLTPPVAERLSPVTVTLLAIRTFFLSLVPDQPVL